MLRKYVFKLLNLILLTLIVLIILKANQQFRKLVYRYVYTENISFARINSWYNSKFGNPLPFDSLFEDSIPVFEEKIQYKEASRYKDGVVLTIDYEYLIPSLNNGIVIFVGEKEEYGNTVIVQQENGVDVWYSNINEINVKLYDYIKKGSLIGSANEKLYLVFIKNGEVVNYEEYI